MHSHMAYKPKVTEMNRNESDLLLAPGAGSHPAFGIDDAVEDAGLGNIQESMERASSGKERWWIVATFSLIACLASVLTGLMLGFSSNTALELDHMYGELKDKTHGIEDGSIEASLFGAFGALGALFGAPIAWPLSDRLGRKPALMLGGVPIFIGWVMIIFAHMVETRSGFLAVLLLGRIMTGFGAGWCVFCVAVYVAETSSAKLRGLFCACNQLLTTVGILVIYGLGTASVVASPYHYYHNAVIAAGVVVIFEVLMLVTKETPRWLLSHGKSLKANKVLSVLRGPDVDIQKEMRGIEKAIEKTEGVSVAEVLQMFKHRSVYIPFILTITLMIYQQLSGINAAIFYAGSILQQAGVGGDGPDAAEKATIAATMAVGVVQVIFTCVAVVLVDLFGRKVLLVVSSIGMCFSSVILGVHFMILDDTCHGCLGINCTTNNITHHNDFAPCDSTNLGWLAIMGLVILIATFSLAWGPVPWIAVSELLPLRIRSFAASIVTLVNWTWVFIVTFFFHSYADAVTPKFAWWSFAFVMLTSIFFVIFFLPEAKGKSLEEIEEHFEQGHITACSCRRKSTLSGYSRLSK